MENSIQIQGIRNMLSHSGCPEDLLESYLQFLQTEGQQVQIVRGEVFVMYEKEAQYRKRRNEKMKGTVTFCKNTENDTGEYNTGVFIGMEFIQCCFNHGIPARVLNVRRVHGEVTEIVVEFGKVDERNTPIAELRPNSMGGIDGKIPPTHFIDI